jgi:hypothetical protein
MANIKINHSPTTPGDILEGNILAWITDLGLVGISRPYIWPGTLPEQDLLDMSRSLPDWIFDSAWIYYEHWDPEIPDAVERFNRDQTRYHARTIHRAGAWRPPRDIIAVTDRTQADQVIMSMWLGLGQHPRR